MSSGAEPLTSIWQTSSASTWVLVERPTHKRVIHTKFVYKVKVKVKPDGSIYKARFVALGYSQRFGVLFSSPFDWHLCG
jgi:hypothetical protein